DLIFAALTGAHQANIVGIGNTDVANTAEDILGNVTVTTASLAGQIVLDASQPLFGFFCTVVCDVISKQCGVIRVLAGANANLALVLWISKVFIVEGCNIKVLGCIENASTHRKCKPVAVRIT